MKVGDLVKVKYDGRVRLVTKIRTEPGAGAWVQLHSETLLFRPNKLEAVNESR